MTPRTPALPQRHNAGRSNTNSITEAKSSRRYFRLFTLTTNKLRPRWQEFYDVAIIERIMPRVQKPDDFQRLIGLHQVHVHSWQRDGMSYIGLEFGCSWDQEHGLGIMLHGSRVVDIGSADTSFAWAPEEAA